ncbi:MAG: hypothetical protein EXS31_15525 [Pedosphaera sp.]|nr:hypothetical protein [Pedosphaera sp.]
MIYRDYNWGGTNGGGQIIERDLKSNLERVILRTDASYRKPLLLSPNGAKLAYIEQRFDPKAEDKAVLFIANRADGVTQAALPLN